MVRLLQSASRTKKEGRGGFSELSVLGVLINFFFSLRFLTSHHFLLNLMGPKMSAPEVDVPVNEPETTTRLSLIFLPSCVSLLRSLTKLRSLAGCKKCPHEAITIELRKQLHNSQCDSVVYVERYFALQQRLKETELLLAKAQQNENESIEIIADIREEAEAYKKQNSSSGIAKLEKRNRELADSYRISNMRARDWELKAEEASAEAASWKKVAEPKKKHKQKKQK